MEEVLTTSEQDRRNKLCRCHECGETERCTYNNDYYTVPGGGQYLFCEGCMWERAAKRRKGIK